MTNRRQPESKARRDFLRKAAVGGGAAAAVAAVPSATLGSEAESAAQTCPKGYQLTQHVLDYYKSASE